MAYRVDFDPFSGIAHYVDWGEDDVLRYWAVQETDPIFEFNRMRYNEAPDRMGDGAAVASIPMVLWQKLKTAGIIDDPKALRRWLLDPDHQKVLLRRKF